MGGGELPHHPTTPDESGRVGIQVIVVDYFFLLFWLFALLGGVLPLSSQINIQEVLFLLVND